MSNPAFEASQRKAAKVAGGMFLLSLFVPMLNWTLVNSKFIVTGNAAETVHRVLANQTLFRLGLINDIAMSVIAIVLAWTLYLMLKPVNKPWAQLALALKVTEGVLIAVIALVQFAALLVLDGLATMPALDSPLPPALIGQFLNTRMSLAAFPMLFLGLNFSIFLSLLYQSRYVPRALAAFGVASYALILFYAVLTILFPDYAANIVIQTVAWAPSCIFELAIGIWLLVKGVRVHVCIG
jgi:hypothetical protein